MILPKKESKFLEQVFPEIFDVKKKLEKIHNILIHLLQVFQIDFASFILNLDKADLTATCLNDFTQIN